MRVIPLNDVNGSNANVNCTHNIESGDRQFDDSWSNIINQTWPGIFEACDCRDIKTKSVRKPLAINNGGACLANERIAKCKDLKGISR